MSRLKRPLGLLLLLACWGLACHKQDSSSPAEGQLLGGIYTNHYFHLTLAIPNGWSVGELKTRPATFPGSSNPPPRANPEVTAHQLLLLSEKPLGTSVSTNPSLLIMAEKTASVPGVKDAKDYVARISQLMTDSPIAYRPVRGIADVQLGGAPAVRLDFSARLAKQKSGYQAYVVCQRQAYLLSFILSGPSEKDIKGLEQVLSTLRFH